MHEKLAVKKIQHAWKRYIMIKAKNNIREKKSNKRESCERDFLKNNDKIMEESECGDSDKSLVNDSIFIEKKEGIGKNKTVDEIYTLKSKVTNDVDTSEVLAKVATRLQPTNIYRKKFCVIQNLGLSQNCDIRISPKSLKGRNRRNYNRSLGINSVQKSFAKTMKE